MHKVMLNPYLNFKGQTKQAMEFYHSIFGGELNMTTFKEGGMPVGEDEGSNIMHAQLEGDNGIVIMSSDTPDEYEHKVGNNVNMSLSGEDEDLLTTYFTQLSEGGNITQPLEQAPWGDKFGMFTDQFGINWLVNIAGKKSE